MPLLSDPSQLVLGSLWIPVCVCVHVRHVYVEWGPGCPFWTQTPCCARMGVEWGSRVSLLDTDPVLRPRGCGVGLQVSLPASDLVLRLQERFVVHITDVLAVSMMLGITAQVKEAGIAWDKGEKRSKDAGVAQPCSVGVSGPGWWLVALCGCTVL